MFTFDNFNAGYIYVIGDVMVDHYIYGSCDRISPEAPVQVVDMKSEEHTLGGAGNVVKNLVAFGGNTGIISVCGADNGFEIINSGLQKLNVTNYKIIVDYTRRTTFKTRIVSNKHQLLRLDREDKHYISDEIAGQILEALKTHINEVKILILSDYCKGVLSERAITSIIGLCMQNGIKTIVDSKEPILAKYLNADIIKPNKKEASLATGIKIIDDSSLHAACLKISEQTNCKAVVVTLSEDGIAVFNEGKLNKIPTKALDVFDVTGAGDTVVAAIAFALLNNFDLLTACDFANSAAAIVVGKAGSATASLDEINRFQNRF